VFYVKQKAFGAVLRKAGKKITLILIRNVKIQTLCPTVDRQAESWSRKSLLNLVYRKVI